jgi:hypothetical protein
MEGLSEPVTRQVILGHHDCCAACATLYAFARTRGDLGALDAWRRQLAVHTKADSVRQDFNHRVVQWPVLSLGSGWTLIR